MQQPKFVIKHDAWGSYRYYSSHGEFEGKKDVVSYTTKDNAKTFETEKEAELFISNKLPDWTKKERYVVEEITPFEMIYK